MPSDGAPDRTTWSAGGWRVLSVHSAHDLRTPGEEGPDAVWVSEVWTDKTAHDASLHAEDIRQLVEKARPLIADVSDQTELTIHGGKGVVA